MKDTQHLNLKAEGREKQAITFPITITDHYLKELVWKLDKVWAKVPNPNIDFEGAYTQSKAREESAKLITEYFGNVDEEKHKVRMLQEKIKHIEGMVRTDNMADDSIRARSSYLVKFVDPEKMYPVSYSIKQDGTKIYQSTHLKGADLTEKQIVQLFYQELL